ncbi:class I SAM-dependent methyltransferase [Pendulispora albinea]|uniref:Class I SAM-dependent methyltransferase n=1 Tax=Pendulispora albinea TaxID=2741071 RepID=A0ABZ2LKI3_9BACT
MTESATSFNRALYDDFWRSCPDFSRYNPGVLHRRRAIRKLLESIRFKSLLDVGCGDAQLLYWLRGEGVSRDAELTGCDLSPETVETNRVRHPFASFHVLDLETAPLARTFDAVICTEVIEHIENQAAAMRNLAQMVAPGGHLIVTCPTGKVHATERHFGHVRHPRPQELAGLLEGAGLEVVSLQNWGFPFYVALKHLTNLNADWALKNFGAKEYSPAARMVSKALYHVNHLNLSSSRPGCQLFALARRAPGA